MKKKKQKAALQKESTPITRMDDACYSPDPLDAFLKRRRYVESGQLEADRRGTEHIERRIREEEHG
jgi:hypothetical protein